jgi:hypothetical protein
VRPSTADDAGYDWRGLVDRLLGRGSLAAIVLVLVGGAVVAALVVGSTRLPATSSSALASGVAIPSPGEIWFGADVDPASFAISGRSEHAAPGTTVSALAHLAKPVVDGSITVEVRLGDTTMASHGASLAGSGARDLVTWTFAVPATGTYTVTVLNGQGTLVATGTLAAP